MKKKTLIVLSVAAAMAFAVCMTGCGGSSEAPSASAKTGTYTGQDNDGVQEFLGIRYGDFRAWKPATDVTTTKDDEIKATEWGENCIQPYDEVEVASQDPCSQDCLFLNVWTKDTAKKDKPVIFWIHGGSYIWGGTTDPMYHGANFVRNLAEDEDCVFVSINYRLSIFGGLDLSSLEGYTDDYAQAPNLAKLDQTQALKWVNENIEAWGGNPENVTIMGHSSGGAAVEMLYTDPDSNQYFSRAIECSGVEMQVAMSEEQYAQRSQQVFDILGAKSVDELTSMTDEQLSKKMKKINKNVDGLGNVLADGNVISKTWWQDFKNGSAKDIDLMLGSVNGEEDWDSIDWENGVSEPVKDYTPEYEMLKESYEKYAGTYGRCNYTDIMDAYMAQAESEGQSDVQAIQSLHNDSASTYPNYMIGDIQSKYNDNVYVYYWEYAPDKDEVVDYSGDAASVSPWNRALHSMSVNFIFGNKDGYTEQTGDPETMDKELIAKTQSAIYNFAKTGDPNSGLIPQWNKYSEDDNQTMVIKPDKKWSCESNYRQALMDIMSAIRPIGE